MVSIEDKVENTFTDLSSAGSFHTVKTTKKIEGTGRFFIHTKSAVTGSVEISNNEEFVVLPRPKQNLLHIEGDVENKTVVSVFDLMGRKLIEKKLEKTSINSVNMEGIINGTYVVFIQSSTHSTSKKINWLK